MKKVILAVVMGISAMSFVSCGNTEVNEDNIKNKYNVDEYVEKGATVEKYLPSGSVVMKDSKGTKFYLGKDSSYKVALNDEGIILPYVDVNDNVYYFDSSVKALPEGFEKSGRISSYGGSENLVKSNIKDSYSFIQSLTVYSNPKEKGLIYTQYRGEDNYDVWKIYEGLIILRKIKS